MFSDLVHPQRSLSAKLFWRFFLISLPLLAAGGVIVSSFAQQQLRREASEKLAAVAADKAVRIETYARSKLNEVEFIASQPAVVGLGLRVIGRRMFRTYPFEEAFFLPQARQFREALTMPLILLGGVNTMDTVETALLEGFEFVGMARALLCEPGLIHKFPEGTYREGL